MYVFIVSHHKTYSDVVIQYDLSKLDIADNIPVISKNAPWKIES